MLRINIVKHLYQLHTLHLTQTLQVYDLTGHLHLHKRDSSVLGKQVHLMCQFLLF